MIKFKNVSRKTQENDLSRKSGIDWLKLKDLSRKI